MPWISLIGKIAAVTFTVHGFNVFIVNIMGNYVLVHESGVPKYTVDPKKVFYWELWAVLWSWENYQKKHCFSPPMKGLYLTRVWKRQAQLPHRATFPLEHQSVKAYAGVYLPSCLTDNLLFLFFTVHKYEFALFCSSVHLTVLQLFFFHNCF